MTNGTKYFIGNWKMFGIPSSFKIITQINRFINKDKRRYKVIIAPPLSLLQDFTKKLRNKRVMISAQNCYQKDNFGAYTGNVSPFMIKKLGVRYIIIGHSENRASGETNKIIEEKVKIALKNNFTVILCIGENKIEKRKKQTINVLKKQLNSVLKKKLSQKKLIIAYEPIWSIGTGKLPNKRDLINTTIKIRATLSKIFNKNIPPVLYGGSVDSETIYSFKDIGIIDGFLIGGASKSSKNFIDIIKNFYK